MVTLLTDAQYKRAAEDAPKEWDWGSGLECATGVVIAVAGGAPSHLFRQLRRRACVHLCTGARPIGHACRGRAPHASTQAKSQYSEAEDAARQAEECCVCPGTLTLGVFGDTARLTPGGHGDFPAAQRVAGFHLVHDAPAEPTRETRSAGSTCWGA